MNQYYKTIKILGDTTNIAYWHGDMEKSSTLTTYGFDHIIPLGTRKPRNIPKEAIMQF